MTAIPFPVTTAPGYRSQESQGRLINCFAEPMGEGSKDVSAPAKRVRVPGMTAFLTSSNSNFQGMALLAGTSPIYAAYNGSLYKGSASGGALSLHANAALPSTTATAYFARNNNALGADKVVVCANQAFVIVDPSTVSTLSIPGSLPAPNCVCMIDGYFVFTAGNGTFYASDLNSLNINSLSFAMAEVSPDAPVRPIPFSGRLLIFGTTTLEFWTDVGAQPFPFQRAASVPVGLLATDAVAGWEDGWGSGLLWVANDFTVRYLDGYTPLRVSTPDLERLIQHDPVKSSLLANVYVVDGHPMWSITGSSFTWSYDLNTRKWHERASNLTNRWRGKQSINTNGRWLVGDRGTFNPGAIAPASPYINSGNIYEIDSTNHKEGNDLLPMRVESAPVIQFPQRVRVARADFYVEVGVGQAAGTPPIQTDPTGIISWSDDGGLNWSVPMYRKLGMQGDYANVSVHRTGMSTRIGRRWRFDIADPVYVALFGGDMSAELRQG
jgi:hypothetical protein